MLGAHSSQDCCYAHRSGGPQLGCCQAYNSRLLAFLASALLHEETGPFSITLYTSPLCHTCTTIFIHVKGHSQLADCTPTGLPPIKTHAVFMNKNEILRRRRGGNGGASASTKRWLFEICHRTAPRGPATKRWCISARVFILLFEICHSTAPREHATKRWSGSAGRLAWVLPLIFADPRGAVLPSQVSQVE